MSDLSMYVSETHLLSMGESSGSGMYDVVPGERYHGVDVLKVGEESVTFSIDGFGTHEIGVGRWLYFENLREESYEIYGDEYESTVGEMYNVQLELYQTTSTFDEIALGGIDPDYSILASEADENGKPAKRMAVILFKRTDNTAARRIIRQLKRIFLKEYRLWIHNDPSALSFMGEHEMRCNGYKERGGGLGHAEHGYSYVLGRILEHAIYAAIDEVLGESEVEYSTKQIEEIIREFRMVALLEGARFSPYTTKDMGYRDIGRIYLYRDNNDTALDLAPDGVDYDSFYNTDYHYFGKYNMIILHASDVDEAKTAEIHRNIVELLMKGQPIDGYLDSLGFPIAVRYNSEHYARLGAALNGVTERRRVRLTVGYIEEGHNYKGDRVDYNHSATVETGLGYVNLYELFAERGMPYPNRNDYIKIEKIDDDSVDIRLFGPFDTSFVAAGGMETEPPHRLHYGVSHVSENHATTTPHRYHYDRKLTVTVTR